MMKKRPRRRKSETPSPSSVFHPVPYGAPSSSLPPLPRGQYWLRQPGDTTQYKRLGATTLEPEPLDIGGFKFDAAPARWALAPADPEVITCLKLLRNFYREARWWRKPKVWARNPEKEGVPMFGNKDIIIALYGRNFYITIERKDLFGPHPARLFYRSYQFPKEFAWVAIVQIEGMWFGDERLLKALNYEIRNRNFYQSDETAETPVLE